MKIQATITFFLCCLIFLFVTTNCAEFIVENKEDSRNSFKKWEVYGGDLAGTHYSQLNQINKNNVKQLGVAWQYHTNDLYNNRNSTIQCNPIIVDGVMYLTSPKLKAIALDAVTGKELWVFNPWEGKKGGGLNRGLTYWSDGEEQRVFYGAGYYLYALNAKTGQPVEEFGFEGQLDLRHGLDRQNLQHVSSRTPGVVYKEHIIIGTAVGEGPNPGAPGHIRAFDVRTGERKWIFHTIPHPGEFGYETWSPDSWKKNGGANNWSGFTLDIERGIVYFGTGSPSYDHWGGNRIGDNLFANCIMALNAETGERVWHFQAVHHDLWDFDIPCAPTLVNLMKEGKEIAAVAQPTKMGHLFVLDRDTGEPIYPITEQQVPVSTIPGEVSSPTQPFPISALVYAKQHFSMDEVTDLNPKANSFVKKEVQHMRKGKVFSPPGLDTLLMLPQFNGGSEWPGAAYDPETNTLIVNASNEAEWISMVKSITQKEISLKNFGKQIYETTCAHCHGITKMDSRAVPSIIPLEGIKNWMTKKQVATLLETGRGQMPSFKTFSSIEKKAVIAWLFEEGEAEQVAMEDINTNWRKDLPYVSTGHWDFVDSGGFPVNKRPWGTLNAINLNEGKIKWQVPLGTYPELEAKGIPPTGTFNLGGAVVTAGGLIFIGAARDERMHAFDKDTGALLWEFQMDAGGYATPATYEIDGQQYLVIAAGGGGKPGTKSGDSYYCFTLPK